MSTIDRTQTRNAPEEWIDEDDFSILTVRAIFDEDPGSAFERIAPCFDPARLARPGGETVAEQVLELFCPGAFEMGTDGRMHPLWNEPRAPSWFQADRRWMELCVRLRRDARLGELARTALRQADREAVASALAAALEKEPVREVVPRTAPVGDLLARYLRGEHLRVWEELRAHPAIAGDFREEAIAVAEATMARVARNADLLAERLAERGWTALSGRLRTRPRPQDERAIKRVTKVTGAALPPSLLAFWQMVGGVDFIWNYEDEDQELPALVDGVDVSQLDPLAVAPARDAIPVLDEWTEKWRGVHPELVEPFLVELAPDCLTKADISGGAPYAIALPFAGADPRFGNEEISHPFVDYLRLCFRWAGFPGLAEHAEDPSVEAFVAEMTRDLEPF